MWNMPIVYTPRIFYTHQHYVSNETSPLSLRIISTPRHHSIPPRIKHSYAPDKKHFFNSWYTKRKLINLQKKLEISEQSNLLYLERSCTLHGQLSAQNTQNKKSNSVIQWDIHNSGTSQKVHEVNFSLHSMDAKRWEPQLCELIKNRSVTCVSYAIK